MHFADSIVIFLLALILFGPRKLPEMARKAGKLMAEFRRASNEFKAQIDEELRNMEQQDRQNKMEASAALSAPETAALAAPNGLVATADGEEYSGAEEVAESDDGLVSDYPGRDRSHDTEAEDNAEPVILPPSTGEPVSADNPYLPVAPPEMLEEAESHPHPRYAEALAAEQNASSNHSGPKPESAQAIVNHG